MCQNGEIPELKDELRSLRNFQGQDLESGGWGRPGPRERSKVREQASPESGALSYLTTSIWAQRSSGGGVVVTRRDLVPSQLPIPGSGC